MSIENEAYKHNPGFWTTKGDRLTVVGDYLGRLPSLVILDPKKDEIILDAGCGAGFMSRRIAKYGAKVFGCDRNKELLEQAISEETNNPLGIEYRLSDITTLPYEDNKFDAVACIAVLIHDSPQECEKFFSESYRTLKKDGRIVLSLMHPYLYQENSPNRTGRASWSQYKTVDNLTMTQSQRFIEDYRNSEGKIFRSIVWYHPEKVLAELLKQQGFELIRTYNQYITKEVLEKTNQTGETGYPAFIQIEARKK